CGTLCRPPRESDVARIRSSWQLSGPTGFLQRFKLASDGLGTSEDPPRFVELACFMQTLAFSEEVPQLRHAGEVKAKELLDVGDGHPGPRSSRCAIASKPHAEPRLALPHPLAGPAAGLHEHA